MRRVFLIAGTMAMLLLASHGGAQTSVSDSGSLQNWRRGTAIVLFAGVGGGILGLSTLSFYGRPQEHTTNITTGALLGVLGGLTYVLAEGLQPENPSRGFQVGVQEDGLLLGAHWSF